MLEGLGDKKRLAEVKNILKAFFLVSDSSKTPRTRTANILSEIFLFKSQRTDGFDFCFSSEK